MTVARPVQTSMLDGMDRPVGPILPRPLQRLRTMRRALGIIAFGGCERSTTRGTYCWTREDWLPEAHYTVDKWCDPCIAAAGLTGHFGGDSG